MGLFTKKQSLPNRRANRLREVRDEPAAALNTFRRNRTLTGSLVPGVHGAGERHVELRSSRVQAHDLNRHRRHIGLALLSSLAVVVVLGCIIYQSIAVPKVTLLGVSADKSADVSIYVQKIQAYLNGHFLERSRLTLDTTRLTEYLQQNGAPEVAGVSDNLTYAGLGVTQIGLTMREPVVSWTTGSKTLYVDTDGNSFNIDHYSAPVVQVIDQTGIQAKDNQILISNRFLSFIGKTVGRFKAQGYPVSRIVLPPNTSRQIMVNLDGVAYPVKMTVDRPAGGQSEDAVRSIKYLAKQGITPAEYIDVRVSGKAFYK